MSWRVTECKHGNDTMNGIIYGGSELLRKNFAKQNKANKRSGTNVNQKNICCHSMKKTDIACMKFKILFDLFDCIIDKYFFYIPTFSY